MATQRHAVRHTITTQRVLIDQFIICNQKRYIIPLSSLCISYHSLIVRSGVFRALRHPQLRGSLTGLKGASTNIAVL